MKAPAIAKASCLVSFIVIFSAYSAGAAQSGQTGDQQALAAIRAACAEDAQKFCANVQPGGGRIVACLKEHKDSLSDKCKQAAGVVTNPGGSAPAAPPADPHAKPAPASKGAPASAAAPEPVVLGERWAKR